MNDQAEQCTLFALSGAPGGAVAGSSLPDTVSFTVQAYREKEAIRLADITDNLAFAASEPQLKLPEGSASVKSYMAVPVISRSGHVLGALVFGHSAAGVFTEQEESPWWDRRAGRRRAR